MPHGGGWLPDPVPSGPQGGREWAITLAVGLGIVLGGVALGWAVDAVRGWLGAL